MSSTLWTKRWDVTDLYVWHDELYVWRELCMRVTYDRTISFVWDTDMSSQHTSMYAYITAAVWLVHIWHASFFRCASKRTLQKTYIFLVKFEAFGGSRTRPNTWRPPRKVPTPVHMCTYLYLRVYICMYKHIHIYMYISTCVYLYMWMYMCIYIYICTYIHLCTHIYIYKHVFIYLCICIYMHMFIYTCIQKYRFAYVYIHI